MTAPARHDREPNALDEELVAYLDDELDADARAKLERRLVSEPGVRESLRKLTRVWDALETLPRAEVNEAFATTTVEAVVAKEALSQASTFAMRRSARSWMRGVALLAACALVSFVAVRWFWPDPNQQLANDLPILENYDAFRAVRNIEFLRELHQASLFDSKPTDAATATAATGPGKSLVETNLARLAAMNDDDRALIAKTRVDFEGLDENQRLRIEQLEVALRADPNESELRQVMIRYFEWQSSLSTGQRDELRSLNAPGARIARVKDMIAADLPEPDRAVVFEWVREYAEEEADELLRIARGKQWVPRPELLEAMQRDKKKWQAVLVIFRAAENGELEDLPFNEVDFKLLESRLSEVPAGRLEECLNADMKKLVLSSWLQTMARDFAEKMRNFDPRFADRDYKDLLEKLPVDRKNEIFSLPPEQARQALNDEWYLRNGDTRFGGPGGFMPPPPGGRPFGPRDDDRNDGKNGRRGDRRRHDDDDRHD
ncbi:MAG: hypothetical protein SGJ19_09900 [Planctomycetia bacterium]|nr:hypothetical protein [Planctomycetia bacterium]